MTPISTRPSIGGDALQIRRRGGSVKHTYLDAVLADHPVLFWPLDDPPGTVKARDLSGNGHSGLVAVGHQTLVFGTPGYTSDGATALRQTSAYNAADPASITNVTASVGTGNHAFTVEAAAANLNAAAGGALVSVGDASGYMVFATDANGVGTIHYIFTPTGYWRWGATGFDPTLSDFHHYAFTWDGAMTHLYLDGADHGMPDVTSGSPTINLGPAGIYGRGAFNGGAALGSISDIAAYNYALTAAQIAAHVAAR